MACRNVQQREWEALKESRLRGKLPNESETQHLIQNLVNEEYRLKVGEASVGLGVGVGSWG